MHAHNERGLKSSVGSVVAAVVIVVNDVGFNMRLSIFQTKYTRIESNEAEPLILLKNYVIVCAERMK